MSNNGNKFLPIFQIQYIKNERFLLELDMALVTSIVMKFTLVCFGFGETPQSNSFSAFIWRDFSSLCTALHILLWSSRPVKTYQSCWLPLLGDFSQSTIVLTSVKGEPVLRIFFFTEIFQILKSAKTSNTKCLLTSKFKIIWLDFNFSHIPIIKEKT